MPPAVMPAPAWQAPWLDFADLAAYNIASAVQAAAFILSAAGAAGKEA